MANNTFENTIMKSLQIACLSSIKEDGLLSDRQYEELVERIGEKNSRAGESERKNESHKGQTDREEGVRYYIDSKDCPIWEKNLLTMDEAVIYFNLGSSKIRALTSDEDCEFVVWNGTRRLIKRERFAEYLDSQYSV